MNDRFKFRAWDAEENRMIEWDPAMFGDTSPVTGYSGSFDDVTMPLMQWTGLKDRGGKEIFENDIIQDNVSRIWLVKYNKTLASFVFCWNKDLKQIQTYKRFNEYQRPLTILGNNFQHSELLNGN